VARVLALLAVLLLAACGGGDEAGVDTLGSTSTSPEPATTEATTTTEPTTTTTEPTTTAAVVEPVLLQLTFDGGSCTYEGPTELTPGPVEVLFYNESEGPAATNIASIDEGYTIQDFIDYFGPEPWTGTQPYWTTGLRGIWRTTAPGESRHWEGDLEVGLYYMICARLSPLGVWFGTGLTVDG
jgi:hypothetical protein